VCANYFDWDYDSLCGCDQVVCLANPGSYVPEDFLQNSTNHRDKRVTTCVNFDTFGVNLSSAQCPMGEETITT
jgi:hypothetical protein